MLLPQESPVYTLPAETHDNPLEFYGVFPGEQVGLSSPPALLHAARNTMLVAHVTVRPRRPRILITRKY